MEAEESNIEHLGQEDAGKQSGSPEPKLSEGEILVSVYIGDIPFVPHTPDEGCLDIPIHEHATLEDLKLEIQKRYLGLEPHFQVLLLKGNVITGGERKLSEHGINKDNSELELESAKICEDCGGRVYRIGENVLEMCENCDDENIASAEDEEEEGEA